MRDPARNEREALKRYKHVLQQALGLVARAQWITGEQDRQSGRWFLSTEPFPLRLVTADGGSIYLRCTQMFSYQKSATFRGEWKVHTEQYIYSVGTTPSEDDTVVAWHWHPDVREECHLHLYRDDEILGPMRKMHLPTQRISFEQVLRFLIVDLDVRARAGWEAVLDDCEKRFVTYRSWG